MEMQYAKYTHSVMWLLPGNATFATVLPPFVILFAVDEQNVELRVKSHNSESS